MEKVNTFKGKVFRKASDLLHSNMHKCMTSRYFFFRCFRLSAFDFITHFQMSFNLFQSFLSIQNLTYNIVKKGYHNRCKFTDWLFERFIPDLFLCLLYVNYIFYPWMYKKRWQLSGINRYNTSLLHFANLDNFHSRHPFIQVKPM
jgi:hypothetical protein